MFRIRRIIHLRKLLFFLAGFCLAATAAAQTTDSTQTVELSQIDAAISQAGSNAELSDEQKSALLDSYHRSQGYIKSARSSQARVKSYKHARETASKQAQDLQAKLEVRMKKQGKDTVAAPPDASMKLADVEQQVQRDKAELAALVAKLSDISNQLQTEVERPIAVRERLTALKSRQDELADQLKLAVPAGEASTEQTAQHWLLLTEAGAVRAEIAMLDEESLSQPMRLELLKAQQDSGSFERTQLEARINVFELYAIELHKGAAEEAQSAAKSAEEEAVGKHPLIQKLAEENTALGVHVSDIASELESVNAEAGNYRDEPGPGADPARTAGAASRHPFFGFRGVRAGKTDCPFQFEAAGIRRGTTPAAQRQGLR
jgi:potassium efflux system protein